MLELVGEALDPSSGCPLESFAELLKSSKPGPREAQPESGVGPAHWDFLNAPQVILLCG